MAAALPSKCEQAFAAYLAATLSAAGDFDPASSINTGKDNSDAAAPSLVCAAQPGPEEDPPNTGNYWIPMEFEVNVIAAIDTDGTDPKTDGDSLSKQVEDALQSDTLADDVSAMLDDFTLIAVLYDSPEHRQVQDCWRDVFKLRAYCCATDL